MNYATTKTRSSIFWSVFMMAPGVSKVPENIELKKTFVPVTTNSNVQKFCFWLYPYSVFFFSFHILNQQNTQ